MGQREERLWGLSWNHRWSKGCKRKIKTFTSISVSITCLDDRFIGIPLFFFDFFNVGLILLGIWRRERITIEKEAAVLKLLQAISWKGREIVKCFMKAFLPLTLDDLYRVNKIEEKKWNVALPKERESPGEVCTNNQAPKCVAYNLPWKCASTPARVLCTIFPAMGGLSVVFPLPLHPSCSSAFRFAIT